MFKKILTSLIVLSLVAATYPQARVLSVVQSGTNVIVSGEVPNMPRPWGWTAFATKPVYDHTRQIVSFSVLRRGSDCPTCGISNPPNVPYTLTVPVGNYAGYVVRVNGRNWIILQ